ncbi:MAG TPA: GMP synthase (glutamine-hydrolyzing), partial [Gemmatimonadetes bacterium]|nr:GMP synthase (glutamine-hydrolyzing) [Gemmatimonadota bacterium]
MTTQEHDRVLILDFGSQFTQLIARRIREESVYSEIHPPTRSLDWIREWNPAAVILSGGPNSVYDDGVPKVDPELLALGFPILGICYGMQLIAQIEGAEVSHGHREYGRAELTVLGSEGLFVGFDPGSETTVWCSHGDHVDDPPEGYERVASTETLPTAAFRAADGRKIWGVQFHPEVAHTTRGDDIISNFLFQVADVSPTWTPGAFVEEAIEKIRKQIGDATAVCGLSGGVDSSVAAMLVHRAIGD